jgi:hypothetical protein
MREARPEPLDNTAMGFVHARMHYFTSVAMCSEWMLFTAPVPVTVTKCVPHRVSLVPAAVLPRARPATPARRRPDTWDKTIATAVVGNDGVGAVLATLDMPAERRGTA